MQKIQSELKKFTVKINGVYVEEDYSTAIRCFPHDVLESWHPELVSVANLHQRDDTKSPFFYSYDEDVMRLIVEPHSGKVFQIENIPSNVEDQRLEDWAKPSEDLTLVGRKGEIYWNEDRNSEEEQKIVTEKDESEESPLIIHPRIVKVEHKARVEALLQLMSQVNGQELFLEEDE